MLGKLRHVFQVKLTVFRVPFPLHVVVLWHCVLNAMKKHLIFHRHALQFHLFLTSFERIELDRLALIVYMFSFHCLSKPIQQQSISLFDSFVKPPPLYLLLSAHWKLSRGFCVHHWLHLAKPFRVLVVVLGLQITKPFRRHGGRW